MIRILLASTALSLSCVVIAQTPSLDMTAANKAHAKVTLDSSTKEQPFWSAEQTRQAELENHYKERITKKPEDKKTYAYLAGLYLTNNKTTKAIEAYQDAITHDAENPKLFAALSIAYLHHAKYDMAKAMADEALRIDPSLKHVNKINEYVIAKKDAIDAASKVSLKDDLTNKNQVDGHGSVIPTAVGEKPNDKMHQIN